MNSNADLLQSAILGLCIGDALGVPVEFQNRRLLDRNPVTDMIGYGTYNQPSGTWSDDTSLTLCLIDSLIRGYDLRDIGNTFVRWHRENLWTPHGVVFDIGTTTRQAMYELYKQEKAPQDCGRKDDQGNGNGSLMRILPLAFYTQKMTMQERIQVVSDVASLTHGHIRGIGACAGYNEFAIALLEKKNLREAHRRMIAGIKETVTDFDELLLFYNLTELDISTFPRHKVRSTGYVMHTLEAAIWCLLTSSSYKECVLKAVNLGEDTDTTAAVAGGLAGIYFGLDDVPKHWIDQLARKDDIVLLLHEFAETL
ncbi:MAG: ADP-ribosylglycohydrolase family protein [Calditrichia bacterium]